MSDQDGGHRRLTAVLRGPVRDGVLEERLSGLGALLVLLDERSADAELAPLIALRPVLWPSPWLCLTDELAAEIDAFCAATTPAVLVARPLLTARAAEFPLPDEIVLATPGAVELRASFPVARPGVVRMRLRARWELAAPATLEAHLAAINAASSTEAALRHRGGERASYAALGLHPTLLAVRALLGVRGSRRTALPRIALEAYRRVLVAAKLWELANVDGTRPVPA